MSARGTYVALAMALGGLLACGGDDDASTSGGGSTTSGGGTTSSGGMGGMGGDGGDGGSATTSTGGGGSAPVPTIELQAPLHDFATQLGVPGVEVCEHGAEPSNCATTDQDGRFVLDVPAEASVALTTSLAGYQNAVFLQQTGTDDINVFGVWLIGTEAALDGLLGVIGQTWDPTKGTVAINLPLDGITATLSPSSGEEPFFFDGAAISTPMGPSPGPGTFGIVNVDPGEAVLSLTHDTVSCIHAGWPADSGLSNEQRVLVLPDHLTSLFTPGCQ